MIDTDRHDPLASATLAERRQALLQRSADLRSRVTIDASVMRPAGRAVDRVRGGVQSMRDNRSLLWLGVAALLGASLVRPRTMARLGLRMWAGWQMFERVRPMAFRLARWLR